MKLPQEIEVWYIIPAIRKELAKAMQKKGLKQKEIAKLLGITEAAVSQYMKSKRAQKVKFGSDVLGEIEYAVDNIINGGNVMKEIHRISVLCRKNTTLCKVHRSLEPVNNGCRICIENA